MPYGEIQAIGGGEGGGIQEHIPAQGLRLGNPLESMLDSGHIGLGRKGKQVVLSGLGLRESLREASFVHTHIGWLHRNIANGGPFCPCKLAYAVDGIVIIKGQQILSTRGKGIRLCTSLTAAVALAVKMARYSSGEALK